MDDLREITSTKDANTRAAPSRQGGGRLDGGCSQRTRWYGDARQAVVQGRSFPGLSTAQMCPIRQKEEVMATYPGRGGTRPGAGQPQRTARPGAA